MEANEKPACRLPPTFEAVVVGEKTPDGLVPVQTYGGDLLYVYPLGGLGRPRGDRVIVHRCENETTTRLVI